MYIQTNTVSTILLNQRKVVKKEKDVTSIRQLQQFLWRSSYNVLNAASSIAHEEDRPGVRHLTRAQFAVNYQGLWGFWPQYPVDIHDRDPRVHGCPK